MLSGSLFFAPGAFARHIKERCCFRVEAKVHGHTKNTLEAPQDADGRYQRVGSFNGTQNVTWKWTLRGLYSYKEDRGKPYLEAKHCTTFRGCFQKLRYQYTEAYSYCTLESPLFDDDGTFLSQFCKPPEDPDCTEFFGLTTNGRFLRGSGAAVQLYTPGRDVQLGVTIDRDGPSGSERFREPCLELRSLSPYLAGEQAFLDRLAGPADYVLKPPSRAAFRRERRLYSHELHPRQPVAIGPVGYVVEHEMRDDGEQLRHSTDGATSAEVRFAYFPKRQLRSEQRKLRNMK